VGNTVRKSNVDIHVTRRAFAVQISRLDFVTNITQVHAMPTSRSQGRVDQRRNRIETSDEESEDEVQTQGQTQGRSTGASDTVSDER